MRILSGLSDLLVLVPASLGLIALLVRAGARREAIAYAKALVFCLTAVFTMKFALASCGRAPAFPGVESPSGHVAVAATFVGSLAFMFGSGRPAWQRLALTVAGTALVALIALSRVRLGAHSPPETAVGAATGVVALAIFRANWATSEVATPHDAAPLPLAPLLIVYGFCALVGANRWTAEPWIDALAADFGRFAHLCAP
jgi:membrane-associated phospholipid phosphatase